MNRSNVPATPADDDETGALASQLARAYRRMAAFYRDQLELTGPEADRRARGADMTPEDAAADLERIRHAPPDQVSWFQLSHIVERDPDAATALWHDLKTASREELASGHRTAAALAWQGSPWDRAQFLAIRESFRDDYRPRPGIEAAMVDMAAEAFSTWLQLSERYQRLAGTDAELEEASLDRHGKWRMPHYTSADHEAAIEAAAERAHLRVLRTVKALSDLRRQAVYVSHAGQVNVAHQQVNVAVRRPQGDREEDEPRGMHRSRSF